MAVAQERWLSIAIFHIPSIMGLPRIRIPPNKLIHSIYSCGMIPTQVSGKADEAGIDFGIGGWAYC